MLDGQQRPGCERPLVPAHADSTSGEGGTSCPRESGDKVSDKDSSPSKYTLREPKSYVCMNICTHMFTAVLFTIAKKWKPPTCPSTKDDEHNVVHPYSGILLSHKEAGSSDMRYSVDEP